MRHTTILPPSWWELPIPPTHRQLHLLLLSQADRDGIVQLDSAELAEALGQPRRVIFDQVVDLLRLGVLGTWEHSGASWAWLPHVADYTPTRGSLQRERDASLPAPPRELVVDTLRKLWGRDVSKAEGKAASPRSWGRTGNAAGAAGPPDEAVALVWESWRDRQQRPGACKLGAGVRRLIVRALGEAEADHLRALVRYAYEADEPGPRFWRGANDQRREYLGLDNLLRITKLPARVQDALAWEARLEAERVDVHDDGTTLGPMAAWTRPRSPRSAPSAQEGVEAGDDPEGQPQGRLGPPGTTSSPDPRPPRLSAQCRKILALLLERGEAGVRTSELAGIALKYTGRISELRGAGADVVVAERDPEGDNLYVMINAAEWTATYGGVGGLD